MAQVASSYGFTVRTHLAGMATPLWNGLLKSNTLVSTSGRGGDPIYATAGYVTPTETTDKLPVGVAQTPCAASTTTNVSMLFIPLVPWLVFRGQYGGTATQAKVWTFHSFAGTRGKYEVSDDAGGKCVWIIGKDPDSSFGAYTHVDFLFCQNKFMPIEFDSSHGIAG